MTKVVVLTGITGFIAKHIALELLEVGYEVRGTLRSISRALEVQSTLHKHLSDPSALDRLNFVELDLNSEKGWADAMQGADVLIHTASPFPMTQPRNVNDIINPAVDGTLRALRAAHSQGVDRVVLTSSMAAIIHNDDATKRPLTETDWSDPKHRTMTPYALSKVLAEKAAWDFVQIHSGLGLVAINPGLVLGTPLDDKYGTSLGVIERIFNGKDFMMPDITFPLVHVKDVARLHVQAVESDDMLGKRHIAAQGTRSMLDMSHILAAAYPDRNIPIKRAPKMLLFLLAIFDRSLRAILSQLRVRYQIDNTATRNRTGIAFIPCDDALLETARFLAAKQAARK